MKISLEPHREAAAVRHPRAAGAVLLVLAAALMALAVTFGYVWPGVLAVILAVSGVWNLRRSL